MESPRKLHLIFPLMVSLALRQRLYLMSPPVFTLLQAIENGTSVFQSDFLAKTNP